MRHRLTASRIELARACAWWARPDVEVPASEAGEAAELGTAFHAAAETESQQVEDDDALDEVAIDAGFRRLVLGQVDTGAELPEGAKKTLSKLVDTWRAWWSSFVARHPWYATEKAFSLSAAGIGRALPSAGQRDYSAALEDELPGTVDVVAMYEDGTLVVIDYKTGRGPHRALDHEHQLRHLGAAVARALGAHRVIAGVAHVTEHEVFTDWLPALDALDLAIVAEETRAFLEALPTSSARPGLHCDELYCPARAVCPATRALLADAKLELEPRRRLPVIGPVESDDQAYAVLVATNLVEAWLADRTKAVRAYVDERGGLRQGDRVFKGWPQTRETPRLDVAGAVELLEERGLDGAIKTKRSTSWSAIKEALRPRAAKGTLTDAEQDVRAALRERGAVKVSEFTKYEWKQVRNG